jgi:hypothetical protein
MNNFGVGKGTSPLDQLADPDEQFKHKLTEIQKGNIAAEKTNAKAKAIKKAKYGAAGRNLAEIFMGGIHNVYGNPSKTTKTSEFDEEKAYKRWAKEKSDKETMTLAQQIIADDNKKRKEALKEKNNG